jgi:hypothetical protein
MGTIAVRVIFSENLSCMVAVDILAGIGRVPFVDVLARALPPQLRGLPIIGYVTENCYVTLYRQQELEERERIDQHTCVTAVANLGGDEEPTVAITNPRTPTAQPSSRHQ